MIKLLVIISTIGYFFSIGRAKSNLNGIIWAILSVFLWIGGLFFINGYLNILGLIGLILLLGLQILLATVQSFFIKKNKKREISFELVYFFFNNINSTFSLKFYLSSNNAKKVIIGIFNSNGIWIKNISEKIYFTGQQVVDFDAIGLESGDYQLKIKIDKNEKIQKFTYIKDNLIILN